MSQTAGKKPTRGRRMSPKKRRALRNRRIVGAVVALAAVALGLVAARLGLSKGTILMGAGAVLMLLAAIALWPRRGMPRGLCILLGLVGVALAATGWVNHHYAWTGGRFVPRYALVRSIRVEDEYPEHFTGMASLEALDMRSSTVADFTPIQVLAGLKQLDVRGNYAFDEAAYEALRQALPDCAIRWSVPAGDAHFDSDQQDVDLTEVPLSVAQIKALLARWPDKRFSYLVPLLGERYATNVQALDLRGASVDAQEIAEALELLPMVDQIDLRGQAAPAQTIAALWNGFPDICFMFTCDVPFGTMTTEDSMVTITGGYEDVAACMAYADYMPNLQWLDVSSIELTNAQIDELLSTGQGDKLIYGVSAFGKRVLSTQTELNLDKVKVGSVEAVEEALTRLPKLQRISMCDCGLTEEEMGRLFDAHPEVKFIWWIHFGHYKLRTDATAFTTALWDGNNYHYTSATFAPLRYCTDLMMLDLGHNRITSIEGIRGLRKLRVLILADNKITDISALEDLDDLEYVELFLNDITDLTPLADKQKLIDLNLFYNPIGNGNGYEVLRSMTWLERLWIGGCRLSGDQLSDIKRTLSGTKVNWEGRGSTGMGWRDHKRFKVIEKMWDTGVYVPFS